jgi:hypothetical protein
MAATDSRRPIHLTTAKLTPEAVRHIRASREMGKVLAIDYNVSPATISYVRRGRRWAWLGVN